MSVLEQSVECLSEQIQSGELTIEAVVSESHQKILADNEIINHYITIASEELLKTQIKSIGEYKNKPLAGIPVAVKDNILMKDMKMTCASKMLESFDNPLYDATVVQKLRDAGAIIMGKVNLDEFAMGGSNETSYYGPVKNPYNHEYVSGGSSGGSAAAVASGDVKMALGTDTGGSVRQPAAFNNIVGVKPTYGRISRFGVTAFASSLDQVGIFTRKVSENAMFLHLLSGKDAFDTTTSEKEVPAFHQLLEADLSGKKIAVFEEYLSKDIHPEVSESVRAAIAIYEKMGAQVDIVSLPHLKYVVPAYYIIAPSEASSNLARFDGIHFGYRAPEADTLEEIYRKSRAQGFGKEVKQRLILGTYFLNSDSYDAYYLQAAKLRTLIAQDFDEIFQTHDIILGPTTPNPPFKLGEQLNDPVTMYLNDLCTIPVNLVGLPAITVPAGFTKDGLPMGLQIVGKAFDEVTMYQFAYAFEQETKYYKRRPTL